MIIIVLIMASRYCTEKQVGEWEATLRNVSRELAMDFFLFVCESYNVRSWGSSKVYIRQFQEMYTTITGKFMNRNHARDLYHVRILLLSTTSPTKMSSSITIAS